MGSLVLTVVESGRVGLVTFVLDIRTWWVNWPFDCVVAEDCRGSFTYVSATSFEVGLSNIAMNIPFPVD